jgi:hypothetical protein
MCERERGREQERGRKREGERDLSGPSRKGAYVCNKALVAEWPPATIH